ncbi:hypothetical protein PNEG_01654 [Pneumocystis murina B123]|uniref:Survival Motor Neuron Gemin2-binding domain-containing protein n=1 Tax=Pneumocystis murina (strain B123) TaxID=1069680 RepID=M7NMJ2_PNEMU|nr:hypothetical protein PNEG_01654 [Pneumocystis murina B123]EMR09893.1 hypothetical protein PNEG_01654 [Pneumocystis murina B123]
MTLDGDNASEEKLSYEEIWDDSMLIAAWDAAVHEYKTYHSNVNQDDNKNLEAQSLCVLDSDFQNNCINNESPKESINEIDSDEIFKICQNNDSEKDSEKIKDTFIKSTSITPPLQIFNNDHILKNLLMSWYYAGYYTGYYAGQNSIKNEKDL